MIGDEEYPAWAFAYEEAERRAYSGHVAMTEALGRRCQHRDSGGAQCTADNLPGHEHRIRSDDLPGVLR